MGKRRIVGVDQSPLNAKRWCLTLECGHEQWVTQPRRPKSGTTRCCPGCERVTADTLTDEQIDTIRAETLAARRQNAHTRSLRNDCDAALRGDRCCREAIADVWNRRAAKDRSDG